MRWLLNLPALNNDRHSTKQENIKTALEVCIRTGTGHKHTETWGVMHREMKYSAGFWWRVLNQSQCCHSNLKASTCSSSPLASTPPLLEELGLCVLKRTQSNSSDVQVPPSQSLGKLENNQYLR